MSQLDLSKLPEPLRSKLEKQLGAMPAEYRAKLESQLAKIPHDKLDQVLSKATPLFERAAQKSSSGAKSAGKASVDSRGAQGIFEPTVHRPYDPHDHYNQTIQRGDRPLPSTMGFLVVAVAVLWLLYVFGAFAP